MKTFILGIILLLIGSGLHSQEKFEIEGAVMLSNSEDLTPAPGTIRWTGSDFEGWNGKVWILLTGKCQNGFVSDIDGNNYNTLIIDGREWMIENPK